MWRYVAQSVTGPAHRAAGKPCQDCCGAWVLGDEPAAVLVACVADGAGSAEFGGEGAAIARRFILKNALAYFKAHGSFQQLSAADARAWCEDVRHQIGVSVAAHGATPRDFATTLCVAIVAPDHAAFFQIGDGAIVLRRRGVFGAVFWPQSGEYANSTNFLTAEGYEAHLEFISVRGATSDVALITDGMERMALSFERRSPHPPFFRPLFDELVASTNLERLSEDLALFLQSDSVQARSDDDKTLVIASRVLR